MKISMHAMSHDVFKKALTQLLHLMEKGVANAKARSFDPNVFVGLRLAPDMLPFSKQIQLTSDFATTPWRVSQAFAPILGRNGGGAILNVLSIVSFISAPPLAVYAGSKSAAWSLTNALRNELGGQKTQVLGVHVGYIDTDLTKGFDVPKLSPDVVVASAYDALEAGQSEVLVDEATRAVKQGLTAETPVYLQAR